MIDLGTLGGSESLGHGINNLGQVTGQSLTATDGTHAFLYSNGQMIDLGTLGGSFGRGNDINNLGQVVGSADTPAGQLHAFLYSNGQTIDLNKVIDPVLGMTLNAASSINDEGQILANSSGASAHAFLLTPVPEPGRRTFFGAALLALIGSVYVNRRSNRYR
jgi:probable HAF family extracellular repeat protein